MAGNAKKKILLIEDDEILVSALTMKLKQSGYDVSNCISGDQALDMARDVFPDLILLDIILPKVKGTTIIRQLKHDDHLSHIPVIMLTNLSPRPSLIDEIKGAEPMFFLIKSQSTLEEIIEKVKEALKKNS
ncbi:response regulator [Candidatus Dojkabacteria bacterium]|uniref:Response regulator n=1 Tax=Candidatus Dojkabacteria bacterium TaxID=2099670 RepID=A0A955L1S9_9BACT|nr:response regulator [Candidatus Dojkabacteria bacterium]